MSPSMQSLPPESECKTSVPYTINIFRQQLTRYVPHLLCELHDGDISLEDQHLCNRMQWQQKINTNVRKILTYSSHD